MSSSDRRAFDTADDAGTQPMVEERLPNAETVSPERSFKAVPAPVDPAPAQPPSLQTAITPATAPAQPKRGKGKLFLAAVLVAGLAGGGHYGWQWWTVGRFQESTDNAFLQADKVTVSPKITGFVTQVMVGDNQAVKAGDILATIDERDGRIALEEAQAELQKALAQLEGYKAAVVQQIATVESSKADVTNAEAGLTFATQEAKRYQDLLATGAGTSQRAQQTDSDLRQRTATLAKNRASLDAAQKQIKTYEALALSANAEIAAAQSKVDQAQLNLSYTTVRAPVDGVVGDRSVRAGQLVQAGAALLTVVPMGRDIYLVANFKETQLGHMVEGQPVTFTVDAFSDHVFRGTVDSFSPGTGAQFALLPPENATGNFTKVVQRVPVKIRLAFDDPLLPRLRPGLSVEATVETRGKQGDPNKSATVIGMAETR